VKSTRFAIGGGLLILAFVVVLATPALILWKKDRDSRMFYELAVRKLRQPHHNEEGWWVGDITELYRLGWISREVAKADTAPLNPLVPTPVPFHGYYVRAMESGPSMTTTSDEPTPLKGKKRSRETFSICIYPAEPGSGKSAWIMCSILELRRYDGQSGPVLQFPSLQERQAHWAIVD